MVTQQFELNGRPTMVFDEDRDRLIVTSGLGYLWEWDGTAWGLAAATLETGYFGGSAFCATHDPVRHRVFFISGDRRLWSYDGHSCTVLGPAPFSNLLIADPERARLVAGSIGYGSQLMEWDGNGWQQVADLGAAWLLQGLAYDRARRTAVAVTTSVADPTRMQTWEGNGASWAQVHEVARRPGALAWDPVRRQVLQRGDGTWAWDGSAWTHLASALGGPFWALATDERHGLVWSYTIFLGEGDALMAWDGIQWSARTSTPHAGRRKANFTFDVGRQRAVLFGGLDADDVPRNDVFEWNRNAWRWLAASGPAARKLHGQVYDVARGETLVFGGLGAQLFGDTWAWDGAVWRQLPAGPPPRQNAQMAWDSVRNRVVLMGGFAAAPSSPLPDHWEWDGTGWTQVAAGSPAGGSDPGTWVTLVSGHMGDTRA
jgi:hypothetical protein